MKTDSKFKMTKKIMMTLIKKGRWPHRVSNFLKYSWKTIIQFYSYHISFYSFFFILPNINNFYGINSVLFYFLFHVRHSLIFQQNIWPAMPTNTIASLSVMGYTFSLRTMFGQPGTWPPLAWPSLTCCWSHRPDLGIRAAQGIGRAVDQPQLFSKYSF